MKEQYVVVDDALIREGIPAQRAIIRSKGKFIFPTREEAEQFAEEVAEKRKQGSFSIYSREVSDWKQVSGLLFVGKEEEGN